MYIHWDKSLETGHPLVDAEHRLLVFLFRKLDVAIKTSESGALILHIVHEVVRCVDFHFRSEENLMRETDYPGLSRHQESHRELRIQLKSYFYKIVSKREFPEDLLSFLNDWLAHHIANEDRQVTHHVVNSQRRPVAEQAYPEYLPVTRAAPGG